MQDERDNLKDLSEELLVRTTSYPFWEKINPNRTNIFLDLEEITKEKIDVWHIQPTIERQLDESTR